MTHPEDTRARAGRQHIAVREALEVLADAREDDEVVITNQGSARLWPLIGEHPLDLHYNPSTMGGAIPFALGVALAQVDRNVMVVSGDGSLLMSLGGLVSIVAAGSKNLSVILLDNESYEVTGGQKTPATGAPVDFGGIARSVGFPTVARFSALSEWRDRAARILSAPGPRFLWLVVGPARPAELMTESASMPEQIKRLRNELAS